jgi:hypothetical protein
VTTIVRLQQTLFYLADSAPEICVDRLFYLTVLAGEWDQIGRQKAQLRYVYHEDILTPYPDNCHDLLDFINTLA